VTLPVLLIGAIVLACVAFATPDFVPVLPFAMIFLVCVCVTRKRLSPIALSPPFYFATYLAIVGLLGMGFTKALVGVGGTSGLGAITLEPEIAAGAAIALLAAASIVLLAAAVSRGRSTTDSAGVLFDLGDVARYAGWFLLFGTVELAALVGYLGFGNLLQRADRLVGRSSSIEAVISMAAVAAVVVVAIALFTRRGPARAYAFLLILGFVAYFVAMGTRRLALLPLLLLLAYVVAKRGRIGVTAVFVATAAALIALALPLHFRGQPTHGLLPYVASLSSFALTPDVLAASLNNFLAGFKITALTAFTQPQLPIEIFWISVNPISGDNAGWYQVAPTLRLNRYTPYSAIGELINYGGFVFVAAFAALGVILGIIQRVNDRLLSDTLGRFVAIVALGLVFIFVIQSAQYNLRSDLRYIYFAVGAQAIGLALMWVRDGLARRHGGDIA
jgi:hypothetical protein